MIIPFEIIVSDFVSFCAALLRSHTALAAENLFLRKHLALFSGTRKEGQADDTCRSFRALQTRLLFPVAPHLSHRKTSHVDRLASSCIPPILALEIETSRAATAGGRGEAVNSPNGSRESDLGRRADCR
jgi:hypothetical protein